MAKGIVKWFNNAKGYGFISAESNGQDVFAHFSSIVMEGYRFLKAGQDVTFEIHEGPKGLHATNIQPVGEIIPLDIGEKTRMSEEMFVD